MFRYTYISEYDIPKACWGTIDHPNSIEHVSCPFFSFYGIECCGKGGKALNCECHLVPWTDNKRTPKFEVMNGKKWERCPVSRKMEIKGGDADG